MSVYKRGNVWWFKFHWNGEPIRESTKQKNKRVAEQIEAARRTQLAKGEVGIRDREPVPALKEFATGQFVPHIETNKQGKPRTIVFYKNSVRNLLAFEPLAECPIDQIDAARMDAFKETRLSQNLQISTINRDLATLRRILRFAAAEEIRVIDRAPKVTLLDGENRRERVLTLAEETAYLEMAKPLLFDFSLLSLDCGLRPEEAYRLEWVHFRDGRVNIYQGKTAEARRSIPASPRVCDMLPRRRAQDCAHGNSRCIFPGPTQTGHITLDSLKKQHAAALKASKVPAFVIYTFRHTCLTRWAQGGMDVWTLKRLAGHKNPGNDPALYPHERRR